MEPFFTEALGLEQVGLLHADVAAPGQEVGGVVAGEEGTRRGVALACDLPGKQLKRRWGKKKRTNKKKKKVTLYELQSGII